MPRFKHGFRHHGEGRHIHSDAVVSIDNNWCLKKNCGLMLLALMLLALMLLVCVAVQGFELSDE